METSTSTDADAATLGALEVNAALPTELRDALRACLNRYPFSLGYRGSVSVHLVVDVDDKGVPHVTAHEISHVPQTWTDACLDKFGQELATRYPSAHRYKLVAVGPLHGWRIERE